MASRDRKKAEYEAAEAHVQAVLRGELPPQVAANDESGSVTGRRVRNPPRTSTSRREQEQEDDKDGDDASKILAYYKKNGGVICSDEVAQNLYKHWKRTEKISKVLVQ